MIKDKTKKKSDYKLFWLILLFIIFLLFSEFSFTVKNRNLENIVNYYHLTQLQKYINEGNCDKQLSHLLKMTDVVIRYRNKISLINKLNNPLLIDDLDKHNICDAEILKYELPNDETFVSVGVLDANLSYIYYLSAINANEKGLYEMVPKLLKTAIQLHSDFSFFYIELANYYKNLGDIENSNEQIKNCLSLEYPRDHCIEYIESPSYTEYNQLGFQKKSIDTFFTTQIY